MRRKIGKRKVTKRKAGLGNWRVIYIALGLLFLPFLVGAIFFHKTDSVCANSISCINDLTGKFEENATEGIFLGKKVSVPQIIAKDIVSPSVLGYATGEKRIEVDLSTQHLYAYQGDDLVYDFPVSTGKWGRTPTGTFEIWIKLRATRMSGGDASIGTYYNLPNVPYTMFYYNNEVSKSRGFSVHGAYWHNNFGHPMSHGCINMRIEDAGVLYNWADPPSTTYTTYATKDNPGTKVIVYGQAPKE